MSVLDNLFERAGWAPEPEPISYSLTAWSDWHGRWFARIEFSEPLIRTNGNHLELIGTAMTAAKRRIRRQVNAATTGYVPPLRYSMVGMEEKPAGRLSALTIAERFE